MTDRLTDARNFGYYRIENELLECDLDIYSIGVYNVLSYHANKNNEAFPSITTIANRLNISQRKVIYSLQRLESIGAIDVHRAKKINGENKVNHYTLKSLKSIKPSAQDELGSAQDALGSASHALGVVHEMHTNKNHLNKTNITLAPKSATASNEETQAGTTVPEIIKAWLDASGSLDKKAYVKTGFRSVAQNILDAGFTAQDVNDYVNDVKRPNFTPTLGVVQNGITEWSNQKQPATRTINGQIQPTNAKPSLKDIIGNQWQCPPEYRDDRPLLKRDAAWEVE